MKILVNGSSISRGPKSWPYWIQNYIKNTELVNLSLAGSGNTYVHETTIAELALRQYDFVLVQWLPWLRFDFKVKDIDQFRNTIYTSKYQLAQNDWPEKIIFPGNDQDYVQDNWIFGGGVAMNGDTDCHLNDAFGGFYRHTGPNEQMYHTIMKLISLQSFLKVQNIPYLFVFGRPFKILSRFDYLSYLIDWNHMYTDHYILDMAEKEKSFDVDGLHPSVDVYREFAEHISSRIKIMLKIND